MLSSPHILSLGKRANKKAKWKVTWKQAWLPTSVLQSSSPAWEQGGGQGNGGSPEDTSWLLRGLPHQGAEWRAWCAACGSWCWCPQSWL